MQSSRSVQSMTKKFLILPCDGSQSKYFNSLRETESITDMCFVYFRCVLRSHGGDGGTTIRVSNGSFTPEIYYLRSTKLRECNVFTGVSLSTGVG